MVDILFRGLLNRAKSANMFTIGMAASVTDEGCGNCTGILSRYWRLCGTSLLLVVGDGIRRKAMA